MRVMPFVRGTALAALVFLSSGIAVPAPRTAPAEETVAFNTQSLKYHCKTCTWAIRCTVNCVDVKLSEAKRRGGVACKVCGGTCNPR